MLCLSEPIKSSEYYRYSSAMFTSGKYLTVVIYKITFYEYELNA